MEKSVLMPSIQDQIMKSVSYDQEEIITNIIKLYCPEGIECDVTYSKGVFYKNIQEPKYKFDLYPQVEGVVEADCRKLPLNDRSVKVIMFDPPFVAASPKGEAEGIITKRFGYYKNIQNEMWSFYWDAMRELNRVLAEDGVLIVKCQDVIDSSKQYMSHCEIMNYAVKLGLYPKDLFILIAKNRIIGKFHKKQQHSRKYHSYFWVFKKEKSSVKYKFLNKIEG